MAKILVYNNDANRMETYYRGEDEPMPYNSGRTLTVREFRGSSNSPTLWTDKRAMQTWNSFRYIYGKPIDVGFAFKRPYEGGHARAESALCSEFLLMLGNSLQMQKERK